MSPPVIVLTVISTASEDTSTAVSRVASRAIPCRRLATSFSENRDVRFLMLREDALRGAGSPGMVDPGTPSSSVRESSALSNSRSPGVSSSVFSVDSEPTRSTDSALEVSLKSESASSIAAALSGFGKAPRSLLSPFSLLPRLPDNSESLREGVLRPPSL